LTRADSLSLLGLLEIYKSKRSLTITPGDGNKSSILILALLELILSTLDYFYLFN